MMSHNVGACRVALARRSALREHALLALRFPMAARTLGAFLYGIAPQSQLVFERGSHVFRVKQRASPMPLSRFVDVDPKVNVEGAVLNQAFSAHCLRARSKCTMLDLLKDSEEVRSLAMIGRHVRNSISRGDGSLSSVVARETADRADCFLLGLVGDEISPRYERALRVLEDVQSTGEDQSSRASWVHQVMRALSWKIAVEQIMPILDIVVPTTTIRPSPYERFAARSRIALGIRNV